MPVTRDFLALEPSAPLPDPASDHELTLEVARWLSAYRPPGPGAYPRAPAETVVFGEMARAMRTRAGLGRVALARRARLNPLYLSLLEMGALVPGEIPAVAVAKLAVALGRSLDELPTTPYPPGAEPADEVRSEAGWARLRLGFDTLRAWTGAMTASGGVAATSVSLPDVLLSAGESDLRIGAGQLGNLMTPASPSDEYAWRLVREAPTSRRWWMHAHVVRSGLAAAGVEVGLRMGTQQRWSRVDDLGELHFGDLEPEDIEPLELVVAR
jgi:transcriptional regulator with XRE-family HTH domain